MDTALKVLDPVAWVGSRFSVPVSAFSDQQEAEDFYGTPIDEVGPGGLVSRTTHFLQSMFSPIGPGQAAINVAVEGNERLEPFLSIGEEKLDTAGQIVQALGLNLRGEAIEEALYRLHPDYDDLRESERVRIKNQLIYDVYGPRTRRDKERFQKKLWELFKPTDAERARFKQKLDRLESQRERRMQEQGPGQVNGNGESPGFLSDIIENFPFPVGR
jgi:hypothetical protein